MAREWDNDVDLAFVEERLRQPAERTVDYGVELVARGSDRLIPRRTGETARSQDSGRNGLTGYVAYHSRKARALHENMHVRHRRGRAKFLESTLAGSAAAIRRRALAEFRAALSQGGR